MKAAMAAIVVAVAIVTAIVYGRRLTESPVYLTPDEVVIGLDAHALAETGRDLRGRFLPLYFQINEFTVRGTIWYQPAIMYLTAAVLQVAPLTEWSIRLPAVMVGVLDVILVVLLASRMYGHTSSAVLAVALFALAPAHFTHSRFAMDYIYPLPFILFWLYALHRYLERPNERWVAAATLSLGLGFYSYIAAMMLMGVYFALTGLVLFRLKAPRRHWWFAVIGMAAPLTCFVVWLTLHPEIFSETFARYEFDNPNRVSGLGRLSMYWQYFSPSYLFFNGGSQLVFSTRAVGVFLLPMMVLLPAGILRVARHRTPFGEVLLYGCLTAPAAAILLDEGSAINRALAIVPFAVLISVMSVDEWALPDLRRWWRPAVVTVVVLACVVQFVAFQRDYFGDYRARSAKWFQHNIRGGMEAILDQQQGPPVAVYLSNGIRWVDLYWKFYLARAGRSDLLPHTTLFDHLQAEGVKPGGLVLLSAIEADSIAQGQALAAAGFTRTHEIADADGAISFVVLSRR